MNITVNITQHDPLRVATLEHRGSPALINQSVEKFIEWRKATGLSPYDSSKTFGLAYDDPAATEAEKFRFDICGEVQAPIPENDYGVINKTIPGGRCAKIRHIGPMAAMDEKVRYLYSHWLPESGELPRDFPVFFHYIKKQPEVSDEESVTDIYLLLA